MAKEGFTCKEVKNKDECDCKCLGWGEDGLKILITAYKGGTAKSNRGKNPWTDPEYKWGYSGQVDGKDVDLHAIWMDYHGAWTNVHRAYKKGEDDEFHYDYRIQWELFAEKFPKLCCCKNMD